MIKQDDELDKLEEDVRRLKNQYDLFFAGVVKVPPSFMRHQVESYIHELNKLKIRDNARRFRLSTVLSRYNQYREMWARRMREREEGPLDYRRRQSAMNAPSPAAARPAPPPVTSAAVDPYVKMTPGANGEQVRQLFDAIARAHGELGKPPGLTFDQLAAMVQKQTELVRSRYNVNTVAFRVETVDGKVKLKAKPLQD